MSNIIKRYLVIGPAWVGDMVMAQALFISLKQQNPDCIIDVVAPAWSVALLARMPEVRNSWTLAAAHGELALMKRWRLGKQLRAEQYTHAITLPRSFKAALVPWFARVPQRIGFNSELRWGLLNDRRVLDRQHLNQTVKRFVALGLSRTDAATAFMIPQPRLRIDLDNQQLLLQRLNLNSKKPIVAMMPGAEYGPAKQWPLEYFAELAQQLAVQGYQTWILGSTKDKPAGQMIVDLANITSVRNLCGETRLEDVIDLLASAQVVVSNDSGLMHIAAAVNVPVVAIYGSSSPTFTPPLSHHAEIMYQGLSCSPCFERHCPLGHYNCLREISAADVAQRIQKIRAQINTK
ncbi:MAG: lipopolysaccharide heptosyltransferase II [Gammaproteobacteria bacterium]|nr:lipopolysaccharide heptosyltransferase II [Gammaproteobacteria bacterium]